ncbi:MAG: translation elongation factor Ts [Gammaproteobacteria bacterium]|nr:translation elongation factor Ts [Gammaproteobacteria bacterium]|tara:strand:- start:52168 stop:53049 length:882 start_codon:yes stop_codon:yes gene_type:complete
MGDNLDALKELRDITGAGMLDCKKYLEASSGNVDEAVKLMRSEQGVIADKKSIRIAAEGSVQFIHKDKKSMLIEINSETDFVARSDDFKDFVMDISNKIISFDFTEDTECNDFSSLVTNSNSIFQEIDNQRTDLISKIGENIRIRRFIVKMTSDNYINGYVHNDKIGAMVVLDRKDENLSKDVCMQIVAMNPIALDQDTIDSEILSSEKEIYKKELEKIDKKEDIKRNILEGKIKKFIIENTLLNQPFIKDSTTNLKKILNDNRIVNYYRYQLGDGIEKNNDDFAKEVYSQIK